jgi:hypothetical protein
LLYILVMRVRIVRQTEGDLCGISLGHYKRNQVYDLAPTLANYLVAENMAMFEMRKSERWPDAPDGIERRQSR